MNNSNPVVIAGAGPVGLSVALGLARAGIRSLVLESKPELDRRSRATLIVPRSLALFERLGVLDRFVAEGERNDAIRILRAADRKPILTFDFAHLAGETTTPFALALSQDRTEHILLEAVLASGLAEVRFGEPLWDFEDVGGGVAVTTGSGGRILAGVLIGADGAHSTVRERLGWALEGKTYPTRAVLADVRVAPEADTTAGWLVDPKAQSFTIAIRFADGVWRIIEASAPGDVQDEDLPARSAYLAETIFGAGAWRETLWTAAYRKHERRAASFAAGRVALAGDAGHLNSPAGGQGMNAGLADADLLVAKLVEAQTHPQQAENLLQDYSLARIDAFDHQIRGLTDQLEMMESMPAWLRNIVFSLVDVARAAGIEKIVSRKLSMLDIV